VLDRLGLNWDNLKQIIRAWSCSASRASADRPQAARPGFGRIAEEYRGVATLPAAGKGRTLFVGFSLAEPARDWFGVQAIATASIAAMSWARVARGSISLSMSRLLRMLDCQLARIKRTADRLPVRGSKDPLWIWHRVSGPPLFRSVASREGRWYFCDPARSHNGR